MEIPFHTTISHSIFRLAVVNGEGEPAGTSALLILWAAVWLPLLLPMTLAGLLMMRAGIAAAFISALVLLLLWTSGAVYAALHPNRGLQDPPACTWWSGFEWRSPQTSKARR